MREKHITLLIALSLSLTGCKQEEAFVDLSGIVFLVFVAVTVSKYLSPTLLHFPVFLRLRQAIGRVALKLLIAFVISAIALNAYWLLYTDTILDRILGLVGLSLVVVGYHLESINSEDAVVRTRSLEIVGMGVVITCALLAMWHFGPALLNP